MRWYYSLLPTWVLVHVFGLETFEGYKAKTLHRWFFRRLADGDRQVMFVRAY
jgi:hypothetical protein